MKNTEEKNQGTTLMIENVCRRMVVGAMSQLLVEQLDAMQFTDPIWRNRFKQKANSFKKELDNELNMLIGSNIAEKQFLNLTNLIEDELKDIYTHIHKEVTKVVKQEKDESNKSKEVHKKV